MKLQGWVRLVSVLLRAGATGLEVLIREKSVTKSR